MKSTHSINFPVKLVAILLLMTQTCSFAIAEERPLVVFAASSLTNVLQDLANQHAEESSGKPAILSFGASATIARQIQAGAPADLFISANQIWTRQLLEAGKAQTLVSLVANQLVVVGDSNLPKDMRSLRTYLANGKLAIADPVLSPAGTYAATFLDRLYPDPTTQPQLMLSQNVRQTLRLAEVSGIPAIVYRSDALSSSRIETMVAISPELSGHIIYEAARISSDQRGGEFLEFLLGAEAAKTWTKFGFEKIASN